MRCGSGEASHRTLRVILGAFVISGPELGHAALGHVGGCDAVRDAKQERQADEYAARLLITSRGFREAERLYGPNEHAIAQHLEVTPALVRVWREMQRRQRLVRCWPLGRR